MKKRLPVRDVVVVFECEECEKTRKIDLSVLTYSGPPECCSMPMQIDYCIINID